MKKTFSYCFILFLNVLFASSLFAKNYFICVSSFSQKENAEHMYTVLQENEMPSFIQEYKAADGTLYYRVVLNIPFDSKSKALERSTQFKSNPVLKKMNIKNSIWICESEVPSPDIDYVPLDSNKKIAVVKEEKAETVEKTLVANKEVMLSENTPYSVFVRSYKEEQSALHNRDRLLSDDIDAYILKKYDEASLISFDVHAGHFETEEQAEQLQNILANKGIHNTSITNYNTIAASLEKYNQVVKVQDVSFNNGKNEIPQTIPAYVKKCIQQFPVNEDFQIEEIGIYDIASIAETGASVEIPETINYLKENDAFETNAISIAAYRDDLFDKDVSIIIATTETGSFEDRIQELKNDDIITDENKFDYSIPYGVLHCYVTGGIAGYTLFGTTADGKLLITLDAQNFSSSEFNAFMTKSYVDSNILIYPQLRKTLCVLPKTYDEELPFLYFTLERITSQYVENKNNAVWAQQIKGHWCAEGNFWKNDSIINVGFFDLDYDYNATQTHTYFMNEKESEREICDDNRPIDINGKSGWYLKNYSAKEFSFSVNSYILAIDAELDSTSELSDLQSLGQSLQIWNY